VSYLGVASKARAGRRSTNERFYDIVSSGVGGVGRVDRVSGVSRVSRVRRVSRVSIAQGKLG
jgi:hypothetical protein